jgi:hypothetical protein
VVERAHNGAAAGDEHQQEGSEQLREEAAPLDERFVEAFEARRLERDQRGPTAAGLGGWVVGCCGVGALVRAVWHYREFFIVGAGASAYGLSISITSGT